MTIFYNAFHSPIGAHASLTLGAKGRMGGLGLELGGPAYENLWIGAERADGKGFQALPFFDTIGDKFCEHFNIKSDIPAQDLITAYPDAAIRRTLGTGTDVWTAGELTLAIHSPVLSIPDPEKAQDDELRRVLCPAVTVELTLDNTKGTTPRRIFFGSSAGGASVKTDSMRSLDGVSGLEGFALGRHIAVATRTPGAQLRLAFTLPDALSAKPENAVFHLGRTGILVLTVPAGQKLSLELAVAFFREGFITAGIDAQYFYNRFFSSVEQVAGYALDQFGLRRQLAQASDAEYAPTHLNADQRWQLAHAVRAYYGSTQFLDWRMEGRRPAFQPFWVVNEGEYRMLNTFDLTVDHLFFELKLNPWVMRNVLDIFVERFSYEDKLHLPGGENIHPGGISFTHDMGINNFVTKPGYSSYECFDLEGCFSHMTHEQLVNWILCAAGYIAKTGDQEWAKSRLPIFRKCLESLVNRDHFDADQRDGVMDLDSDRTLHGAEITTYDSLDASLGQARRNTYLAVKTWAAYLALEKILKAHRKPGDGAQAAEQAKRCAATIVANVTADGSIPAILEAGCVSRIIPAIEGLAFPWLMGMPEVLAENGPYGALICALKQHLKAVLVPGVCLYPEGGWKLSSTADNSWLSKIYLCQFVARHILGQPADPRADAAHVAWLLKPENLQFAWSDQMVSGVARGSKYYPRGVTAVLWLEEK